MVVLWSSSVLLLLELLAFVPQRSWGKRLRIASPASLLYSQSAAKETKRAIESTANTECNEEVPR